jgi:hypothetical protein
MGSWGNSAFKPQRPKPNPIGAQAIWLKPYPDTNLASLALLQQAQVIDLQQVARNLEWARS